MTDETPKKICSKCGDEHPATTQYFPAHPACLYGVSSVCKRCRKEQNHQRYLANPEKWHENTRKWRSKEENWKKELAAQRERRREIRAKRRAERLKVRVPPTGRNKERRRATRRAYYHANRERNLVEMRKRGALRRLKNPELYRAQGREWRRNHPLSEKEKCRRYQARKRAVTVNKVNYKAILERDGMFCYICEKPILPHHKLHFDHVKPLKPRPGEPQGTHSEDNIRPTHGCCNTRKANWRFEDLTPFQRRGPDDLLSHSA